MCVIPEFRAFPPLPLPCLLSKRKRLEENAFNLDSECSLGDSAEGNLIPEPGIDGNRIVKK